MAVPRRIGTRVMARPGVTGRSQFYYDTERGAFYSVGSRRVRAQRLDVRGLLGDPRTAGDFRVHKDGGVYFRGENIGWNAETMAPPRRKLVKSHPRPPQERGPRRKRPPTYPYFQRVLDRNPGYRAVGIFESGDDVTAVFQARLLRHRMFAVTTSHERAVSNADPQHDRVHARHLARGGRNDH